MSNQIKNFSVNQQKKITFFSAGLDISLTHLFI